jgi:hypothetical protein
VPYRQQVCYLACIQHAREAMRRTSAHGFAQCRNVGPRETRHDSKSRVARRSLLVEKPGFQCLDVSAAHYRGDFARGNPVFEGNTHQRPHQTGEDSQDRFFFAGGFIHFCCSAYPLHNSRDLKHLCQLMIYDRRMTDARPFWRPSGLQNPSETASYRTKPLARLIHRDWMGESEVPGEARRRPAYVLSPGSNSRRCSRIA